MNKKYYLVISLLLIVILVALYLFSTNKKSSSEISTNTTLTENDVANDVNSNFYKLEDVKVNNSKDNCWTVIDGKVYDLTNYIEKHPGKDRILASCGNDATDLFNGNSPMGRMHSAFAQKLLSEFQIGVLE